MAPIAKETDPLDHLEERIQKAVDLVHRLRSEKEAGAKVADALRVDLEEAQNANAKLAAEIEAMREERLQVRTRLEKLLGHIDQLGSA
jgi:FtsZ-binding cell division protein ZapB